MGGFAGFGNQGPKKRASDFVDIKFGERRETEFENPGAEAVLACVVIALDVPAGFEDHDEAVRGALVEIQLFGELGHTMTVAAVGKNIKDLEGPIQDLAPVDVTFCIFGHHGTN